MRIALAADHAGYLLKNELAARLARQGHDILDLGTHSAAPVDYPDSAEGVASALQASQAERGIIVCGSGAGVSIAANKFPGIRAAVCHDTYTAAQAVDLKIAHFVPSTHPISVWLEQWTKKLEAQSKGELKFWIFPNMPPCRRTSSATLPVLRVTSRRSDGATAA